MRPPKSPPSLVELSQRILEDRQDDSLNLAAALALLDSWAASGWTRGTALHLNSADPHAQLAYWCARIFKRGLKEVTWDGARTALHRTATLPASFVMTPEFLESGRLRDVLVADLTAQRALVVLDAGFLRCWPKYNLLPDSFSGVIVYDPSESTKRLETLAAWAASLPRKGQELLKAEGPTRIWSVGGGITSDLAGFFAGLFGLEHCSSPTTLLSAYDASLGGKTGANLPPWGKNQLGLFHPTTRWVIVPEHFDSLALGEVLCALAEAIKHCWLAGDRAQTHLSEIAALCNVIHSTAATGADQGTASGQVGRRAKALWDDNFVRRSIAFNHEVKAAFVTQDPLEEGVRAALNLGHTLGHILEGLADEGWIRHLPHGLAVATGLKFLMTSGLLNDETAQFAPAIDTLLAATDCRSPFQVCEPATNPSEPLGRSQDALERRFWERFVSLARADKKSTKDIRLVLPARGMADSPVLMAADHTDLFLTVSPEQLVSWSTAAGLFSF